MMDKRSLILFLLFLIIISAILWRACNPSAPCLYAFNSYNLDFPPPSGTPANQIFALSQDYPETYPDESVAWTGIDFHTNPAAYAQAVLAYCLEGNIAIEFKVQNNPVRKWYHAPWLDYGPKGREWHHGMTLERGSRAGELHPSQTHSAISWAVGFYNAPGGYTIRKVWPDCGHNIPDPVACNFPEKTVAFKLLFSGASETEVPYLKHSYKWTANVGPINATPPSGRTDRDMLLLQVDIAVKDHRSPVGWVFGTFVYDGSAAGTTEWDRLKLVGLIWGNDPTVTSHMADPGAFINPDLHETFINASLIPSASTPVDAARMQHLGLGGRLNGPVDNPISACVSCHGKASVLKDLAPTPIDNLGRQPQMYPTGTIDMTKFTDYFGINISAGSGDIDYNCAISHLLGCSGPATFIKTDYSLQVSTGIENYYLSLGKAAQAIIDQQATKENR